MLGLTEGTLSLTGEAQPEFRAPGAGGNLAERYEGGEHGGGLGAITGPALVQTEPVWRLTSLKWAQPPPDTTSDMGSLS
ncbi:hypothetical protein GCM10010404_42870 [Nonomuraea africana]